MVLTPQLRQRIEMLQMTSLELSELIEQEMVTNPLLEEVEQGDEVQEISDNILDQNSDGKDVDMNGSGDERGDSPLDLATAAEISAEMPATNGTEPPAETADSADSDGESNEDSSDSFEEIDFGSEFQDYLDPGYRTQEIEYKNDAPSFEQFLSSSTSLAEHLEWQLNLIELTDRQHEVALEIVGNLDSDGRLTATIEEVGELSGVSAAEADFVRQKVMQLDPPGCGARDVNECLLAQRKWSRRQPGCPIGSRSSRGPAAASPSAPF